MSRYKSSTVIYLIGVCAYIYIYQHIDELHEYDHIVTPTIIILSVISVILLSMSIREGIRQYRRNLYLNSTLGQIDAMSGREFEIYLKVWFENAGYRVFLTPATNDYGADLVCKNRDETIVVQAKRYKGKVGNKAVQEITAAKNYYSADRCLVVTNSYFTKNAVELADCNNVELWDRNNIERNLSSKGISNRKWQRKI